MSFENYCARLRRVATSRTGQWWTWMSTANSATRCRFVTDGETTPGAPASPTPVPIHPEGCAYLTSTSARSRSAPLAEPGSVVVVVGQSHVMPIRCSSVTERHSTFGSLPQSASVEHRPRHWSVTVTKQREQGSVVVVGHPPLPQPQLQGGDPPVQLQRPALQFARTCRMQVPRACPRSALAATSSLQAR